MKNKIIFLLVSLILFCVSFVEAQNNILPTPSKDDFVYFKAKEVIYDENTKMASLNGDVEISVEQEGKQYLILGDNFNFDVENQIISSTGTITIKNEEGTFLFKNFNYNAHTKKIMINGLSASYGPIRILSTEEVKQENNEYLLKKATFTCCDKEEPHYKVYVGSAKLIPDERIYAYNAVLKIGNVPIFYLPIFYRSLNPNRLFTTYVNFEQSGNTGVGFLTSTVYSNNNFMAIGNLDYYTRSGLGYGLELAYDDPENFRGDIQGYTIKDKVADKQRWGINGGFWWKMYDNSDSLNNEGGAIYFSQLETRTLSDSDFNDDFFRSSPYVVSPDKLTKGSVVRQSRVSTFRISYSDISKLNELDKSFYKYETILPSVSWIFNPFVLPYTGGLVNNFEVSFNNKKVGDEDYIQYFKGNFRTSKSIYLSRDFTFTPSVFYDQEVALKDPYYNKEDNFVGRFGTELNLRSDLVIGMLDVGYRFTRRTTDKLLVSDEWKYTDIRTEKNLFYIQNYYMPMPELYFKLGSGYSINDDGTSWHWKDRIEPLLAEVGYFMPKTETSFYFQTYYDAYSTERAFVFNSTFKDPKNLDSFISLGVTNYNPEYDYTHKGISNKSVMITSKFMIAPTGYTWRADMGLDFEINDSTLHAYSKHIKIYKDFHDFTLMLGVRDRNQNLSFNFMINIRCGGKDEEQTQTQKRVSNYWYPWRDSQMQRDI